MRYRVHITDPAFERLRAQARYIAEESGSPEVANRWLERVVTACDTLSEAPRRCALAPEDAFRPYEIRWLGIGEFYLLFTIREQTVWIIGARHGRRRPRPEELGDP